MEIARKKTRVEKNTDKLDALMPWIAEKIGQWSKGASSSSLELNIKINSTGSGVIGRIERSCKYNDFM